nr:hypothetical protein GCM10025732_02420 [Glycomyces mayteni]
MDPARILTALAALAPVNKATAADSDEIGQKSSWTGSLTTVAGAADLAAHDELHRDERLLRQGWGVVTGVHSVDGKRRRVAVPLVTRPVRLEVARTEPFDHKIVPAGDIAVHPRLVGTEHAARLTAVLSPDRAGGDLADPSWLLAAATAAGYAVNAVTHRPEPEGAQPVVLARSVIYVSGPRTESGPIGQALLDWSERPGLEATALAAMYGTADAPEADTGPVRSSLPLNREQAAAVCSARTSPVTVVAGAPGCGKSHTLAAIALDTLARGQSVLIATQSVYAADVLARLLARRPGPAPVMFGDTENGTPAHANPGDAPGPTPPRTPAAPPTTPWTSSNASNAPSRPASTWRTGACAPSTRPCSSSTTSPACATPTPTPSRPPPPGPAAPADGPGPAGAAARPARNSSGSPGPPPTPPRSSSASASPATSAP